MLFLIISRVGSALVIAVFLDSCLIMPSKAYHVIYKTEKKKIQKIFDFSPFLFPHSFLCSLKRLADSIKFLCAWGGIREFCSKMLEKYIPSFGEVFFWGGGRGLGWGRGGGGEQREQNMGNGLWGEGGRG